MRTHRRGDAVAKGTYVGPWLDVQVVGDDGERLDGAGAGAYVRVQPLALLALSPVLGGLFVLAFPLVVLVALGLAGAERAAAAFGLRADEVSSLAGVRYRPAAAWLDAPRPDGGTGRLTDELADLRAEVARRRREAEAR